jgi:hypothetical protein
MSRSPASRPSAVPATVTRVLDSPGRTLDQASTDTMRSRLGHDFSSVRVHDDAQAAASADDIGARAYAFENHVVFGANGFSVRSPQGRDPLAHGLIPTPPLCAPGRPPNSRRPAILSASAWSVIVTSWT